MEGLRFGSLTVLRQAPSKNGRRYWHCKCDCGNEKSVIATNLRSGHTKGCGCNERKATHGHTTGGKSSPTYHIWSAMVQRCINPKTRKYNDYGGRGIKVCDRWRVFQNFLDDMGVKPHGLSLDRIDNNGNYEPGNCRWATGAEQVRNRRAIEEIRHARLLFALREAKAAMCMCSPQQRQALATINKALGEV